MIDIEQFQYSNNKETTAHEYTIYYDGCKLDEQNNALSPNEQHTYAKLNISYGNKKYLIRIDNLGKLYNPISHRTESKKNIHFNNKNNRFSAVSEKIFEIYLKFLRTKKTLWLTLAERERY